MDSYSEVDHSDEENNDVYAPHNDESSDSDLDPGILCMAVRVRRLFSSVGCLTRGFHLSCSKVSQMSNMTDAEKPIETAVRAKLSSALKPEHLDVINESSMHNVPPGTESHFKVVIVSSAFENISRIKKHQLVHQAIQEELDNDIHALSIVAKTPKEWEANSDIGKSPPCRGGAGL